jgi:hypothetical protein
MTSSRAIARLESSWRCHSPAHPRAARRNLKTHSSHDLQSTHPATSAKTAAAKQPLPAEKRALLGHPGPDRPTRESQRGILTPLPPFHTPSPNRSVDSGLGSE